MAKKSHILAVILLVLLAGTVTVVSAATDSSDDHVIHATGTGNVIGTPDRAQVVFSVQTENVDVKVAQSDNARKMNSVITALVNAGIPRDALKTTGYNIYPIYDDGKTLLDQKVKLYRVTNTLTVTLHDVNRTGDVIDVAVANGVNQADSIQFMLSDEQSQVLRTRALQNAVARARADADTVAAAMGTNITGVRNADVTGGYTPFLYQNYQYETAGAMNSVATPTPIQPGDITVSATVMITYAIQ